MKRQAWLWGTLLLGAFLMASPASASEKTPSSPGKSESPGLLNHALEGVGTIVDSAVTGLGHTIDTGAEGLGSTLAPVEKLTVDTLQQGGETVQALLKSPDQPEVWAEKTLNTAAKTLDRTVKTVEEVTHKAAEATVKTTGKLARTADQTLEAGVDTVTTGLEDSAAIVKKVKSSIPALPDHQKQKHTHPKSSTTPHLASVSEDLTSFERADQNAPLTWKPEPKDGHDLKEKEIPRIQARSAGLNEPIKRSVKREKNEAGPTNSNTTHTEVSNKRARSVESDYGMTSGTFTVAMQTSTNSSTNTGGAGSGSGQVLVASILPGWNTEMERSPISYWPGSLYAINSQWAGEPGSPPPQHFSSLDDAHSLKLNEER